MVTNTSNFSADNFAPKGRRRRRSVGVLPCVLASMRSDNVAARSATKNAGRDVGLRIDINIHCSVIDIIPGLTIALDNENTRLLGL